MSRWSRGELLSAAESRTRAQGWGQSFHFANKLAGESFSASIARHEYYLALRLGIKPNDLVLDCGCGIGGPLRNLGQFTEARITGVTLNQYQVNRGNVLCAEAGLADKCKLVQARRPTESPSAHTIAHASTHAA